MGHFYKVYENTGNTKKFVGNYFTYSKIHEKLGISISSCLRISNGFSNICDGKYLIEKIHN